MIHYYIVYNQIREKQIIKIKSENESPCTERDEQAIKAKSIFKDIAYIGYIKSENNTVGAAADNSITGQQRP